MGGSEAWRLKSLGKEMGHSVLKEVLGLVLETIETS